MPTLTELPDDVRVAFFGQWTGVDQNLKVPAPEPEELCQQCIQCIGSRATGACVKTDEDDWVYYHGPCWLEAKDESVARDALRDELDGEQIEPW